ncbi:MAG: AAA family ATPase, partial [Nanoarchaeota archaeon]
ESNFIVNQIEQLELEIKIKHSLEQHSESIVRLRDNLKDNKIKLEKLENELIEKEKRIAVEQDEIKGAEKIKSKIFKLDVCPLCKTKMTLEHITEVTSKADKKIEKCNKTIESCLKYLETMHKQIKETKETISEQTSEINTREVDIIKISNINDKKQQLHRNSVQIKISESELDLLEKNKKETENKFSKITLSEENYENLKLEVNELARSEERNLGIEITTKQRELERIKLAIKQILRDKESIRDNAIGMKEDLEEKEKLAEEKEEQAEILKRKYQKMFEEKNVMQDKIRMFETSVLTQQNEKRFLESEINNFSISKAGISAKKDNFSEELREFPNIEFIVLPLDKLKEKLDNSLDILTRIGSVNLRALEVYDNIKEEYEKIKLKVEQLEKEKLEILNIIAQIDRKKKKTFLETLTEINQLFSRNFTQLSTKGVVVLEPQDKSEIFNAGLDIIVKTGIGKYFDVTSLSGGEQTLVALALIFAIQEHKPYCFYIFDEIDAALDKRNSEKLAYLLKKYMKEGQYIIVTHNDALISESTNVLYGVSMQDGISKILSLQL